MLVLIGVVATPRASGAMILLPIAGSSLGEAVTITAAAGGRVLAHGPVPGSVVVIGERRRLLGPLLAHGILVAAAPRSWCAA